MRLFQRFFSQSQPPRPKPQGFSQTFILEPILTPSGLVDGPDDGLDFDLPDFANSDIASPMADPPDDTNIEPIDFFGSDSDPELDLDPVPDINLNADETPDIDSDIALNSPDESDNLDGFVPPPIDTLSNKISVFEKGVFTVGDSGEVGIDFLFDGGKYQGELAIFSLEGMDDFDFSDPEDFRAFMQEASERALSDSEMGHVVISDKLEGAKFSGTLPEGNFNSGDYLGVKAFQMKAGDKFAVMLVPKGTVQTVFDTLDAGEDLPSKLQPLFSLSTANPDDAFHIGQIADVTGDGNTFALEDLRMDGKSDRDYNDIVFQVRGATGETSLMDEWVDSAKDWRETELGKALLAYAKPYVEPDEIPDPSDFNPIEVDAQPTAPDVNPFNSDALIPDETSPPFPKENQPLVGIIDTGVSADNPDLDYSRITLGQDRVDGDANPLLAAGEGNEHGTHILGIIGATQDNGIGTDGINDDAPLWVGRAVGSGKWAESLVEFVDVAVESGQPNAVVNLSLDLTQVNPDGSVTTRYEFTPTERAAIEYARQHNVLMVVAAGNDGGVMSALGQSSQEFDNIITVGAAERVNEAVASSNAYDRVDYSSYGYGLDIMAPGGSVSHPELSLTGDGVGTMAGTSVATAKVTGAVSQVWAANPGLSYRQVIEILKDTATDLKDTGWDVQSGAGLLIPIL